VNIVLYESTVEELLELDFGKLIARVLPAIDELQQAGGKVGVAKSKADFPLRLLGPSETPLMNMGICRPYGAGARCAGPRAALADSLALGYKYVGPMALRNAVHPRTKIHAPRLEPQMTAKDASIKAVAKNHFRLSSSSSSSSAELEEDYEEEDEDDAAMTYGNRSKAKALSARVDFSRATP
jgi:hypothetical protein